MFRILQLISILMIIPMMCLGLMVGLSGGGLNPTFQQIGRYLFTTPIPMAVVCLILAEVLWRMNQTVPAYIVMGGLLIVWSGLLVWLQLETGFFS